MTLLYFLHKSFIAKSITFLLMLFLLFSGCASYQVQARSKPPQHMSTATAMIGLHERRDTRELKSFLDVNPRYTEWCAAFVGATLEFHGHKSTNSLMARSYLGYGKVVLEPEYGDILIFTRGKKPYGHVGFFVREEVINGKKNYLVLGGNQDNEVSMTYYPARRLLGIRRIPS